MSFPFSVPLSQRDVITPTTNKIHKLGTRGELPDGRIFRYAQAGSTALVKGKLCQSEAPATRWENATLSYLSTQWPSGSTEISTTWAYIPLTCTKDSTLTVAKDYFQDGYIWAKGTSTECGQMMIVAKHDVCATSDTSIIPKVYFEDDAFLSEAIDTASFVAMQKNVYDDVIETVSTNPTGLVVGVPNCDVSGTYYFWLQTWGACAVKQDAEVAVAAKPLLTSTDAAGTCQGITATTGWGTDKQGQKVGVHAGEAQSGSEHIMVHLTLAP
jgi:hypothetical protein